MGFLLGLVLVVVVAAIWALPGGWALMVAIGMIHGSVFAAVQPVGFWFCVGLSFLLRLALGSSSVSTSSK